MSSPHYQSSGDLLVAVRRCVVLDMLKLWITSVVLIFVARQCESGSCPPTLSVDVCDAQCGPLNPCKGTQMCCPTACNGAMCVDAMSERHFVNLVKKGRCPEYPQGVWICSHMCTGDTDCPRTLKCCANRCGALTCQRPEFDDDPNMTRT